MDVRELYIRQHQRIYRLAMLYLKNSLDAEDAVQNVFLKYMKKSVVFQDCNHENAWFITVTRNYCRDELRSFWRRSVDTGELPEFPSEKEEESRLLEKVMRLPDKYREVLYLFYYEKYSVREMSELLSRKESTIQTQLASARKKLKKELEKEDEWHG